RQDRVAVKRRGARPRGLDVVLTREKAGGAGRVGQFGHGASLLVQASPPRPAPPTGTRGEDRGSEPARWPPGRLPASAFPHCSGGHRQGRLPARSGFLADRAVNTARPGQGRPTPGPRAAPPGPALPSSVTTPPAGLQPPRRGPSTTS